MAEEEKKENNHDLVHQEQVIVDIVSRLPIESVLQCRCVCKRWNSLLHEPYFTQIHFDRTCSSSSSLNLFRLVHSGVLGSCRLFVRLEDYHDDDDQQQQQPQLEVISKPINHTVILLRDTNLRFVTVSCNGLICLFDHNGSYIVPVIIYNPMTREYLILPDVSPDESKYSIIMNRGGVSAAGFGYNPRTKEYKVVRVIHLSSSNTNTNTNTTTSSSSYIRCVRVYTFGSGGKWRIKEDEPQVGFMFKFKGVLANGALHWLTIYGAKLVSFDLEDEKFRIMSPSPPPLSLFPQGELTERAGFAVGLLGQNLCITVQKGYVTDIWVMNNNNTTTWSKEFSISTSIPPDIMGNTTYCQPVGFTKRGRILCIYNKNHLICYDPITNRYDQVGHDHHDCNVGTDDFFRLVVLGCVPQVVVYRKSIVSLKALGEDAKLVEQQQQQLLHGYEFPYDEPIWLWLNLHRDPDEVFGRRSFPGRIYSCSFTNNSKLSCRGGESMKTKIIRLCISFVFSFFEDYK